MSAPNEQEVRRNVPQLETRVRLSKDRRWVVTKTIITDIRPARYFERMLAGESE